MSLKSNQLLKTIKKGTEDKTPETRLAIIKAVSGSTYKVQFYGEEETSQKYYQKLSSASISATRPVLMQKVNGTYIIMGNV